MKSTRNLHHIDIDDKKNWEIKIGDKTLYFDPEYRLEENAIQYGKIIRPAMSISKRDNMIIPEEGDTVYFHHHVFTNKITFEGDNFRWATHDQLYFIIRENEIIMLNDFILVKPKIEDEVKSSSGILLKSRQDKLEQRGIVVSTTKKAKEIGLKDGMEISYTKNSDYSFDLKGDEYYMMSYKDVVGYISHDNGKEDIVPVGEWSVVEALDEDGNYVISKGVYIPIKQDKHRKHRGMIYKTFNNTLGIKDGDKVIFDRKGFYSIIVNNKKYYGVHAERDIFILL